MHSEVKDVLEMLESVLCDPTGASCIKGSDGDRATVDAALNQLRAAIALPVPQARRQAIDIHSCSYFCDRPACIKTQRDQMREQKLKNENF